MVGRFEFLEHPSDVGILAHGENRREALIALSQGLANIIVDPSAVACSDEREFRIQGIDAPAQVINWLNEILFFLDTEGLLLTQFEVDAWTENEIRGRGRGETLVSDRHTLRTA